MDAGKIIIGDKVRLTQCIWDDGEDHHPPGWLAAQGEIVIVRGFSKVKTGRLAVSHADVTDGRAFMIDEGEYELEAEVAR